MEILPDDLRCPITKHIMIDPVLAEDGFVYERFAIQSWLDQSFEWISPMTGIEMPSDKLFPAKFFECKINELLKSNPELKDEQFKIYYKDIKNNIFKHLKEKNYKILMSVNDYALSDIPEPPTVPYSYEDRHSPTLFNDGNTDKLYMLILKTQYKKLIRHVLITSKPNLDCDCFKNLLFEIIDILNDKSLQLEIIKYLFENTNCIFNEKYNGNNLATYSGFHNNFPLVKYFISKGISIDKPDDNGNMPLQYYFKYCNQQELEDLFNKIKKSNPRKRKREDDDSYEYNTPEASIYNNIHLNKKQKREYVYRFIENELV